MKKLQSNILIHATKPNINENKGRSNPSKEENANKIDNRNLVQNPRYKNSSTHLTVTRNPQNKSEQDLIFKDADGQITLTRSGEISADESLPDDLRDEVVAALSGKLNLPPESDVKDETISIKTRGTNAEISSTAPVKLLYPVGTIRTDRPLFKWQPHKEATAYKVIIVDNEFNITAESPLLTKTEWQIEKSLERRNGYRWQVKVYKSKEELPVEPDRGGQFNLLSSEKYLEITETEKSFKSHLVLALAYLKAGLRDEAEKELCKLQKLNPRSRFVKSF